MATCSQCELPVHGLGLCWRHYRTREGLPTTRRKARNDEERWAMRVLIDPDGCWLWTGSTGSNGYGQVRIDGRLIPAHRWAYEYKIGPISSGMRIDHTCHNADPGCRVGPDCPHMLCVRPDHLEAVTHGENIRRATFGRGVCKAGLHDITKPNAIKGRQCRECVNESNRRGRQQT
jgi:hypothetical protein